MGEQASGGEANITSTLYPFGKRGVRLSLHKDVLAKPAPIFAHKTEIMGKDVTRELQRIVQKYGKLILIGESQI
jgi:hypothetical protein